MTIECVMVTFCSYIYFYDTLFIYYLKWCIIYKFNYKVTYRNSVYLMTLITFLWGQQRPMKTPTFILKHARHIFKTYFRKKNCILSADKYDTCFYYKSDKNKKILFFPYQYFCRSREIKMSSSPRLLYMSWLQ